MADDDSFLRIALHIDDRTDMDVLLRFLKAFYADLHTVGNLLVVEEQDLLADNLTDEEASRFVGQLVLVEVWRRVGQQFLDALQQDFRPEFFLG